MLARDEKEKQLKLLREKRIRAAKNNFWEYNKLESPDFYNENNWHLKLLSYVLQALYERKLTKEYFIKICKDITPSWFFEQLDVSDIQENFTYKKLMLNMPP